MPLAFSWRDYINMILNLVKHTYGMCMHVESRNAFYRANHGIKK